MAGGLIIRDCGFKRINEDMTAHKDEVILEMFGRVSEATEYIRKIAKLYSTYDDLVAEHQKTGKDVYRTWNDILFRFTFVASGTEAIPEPEEPEDIEIDYTSMEVVKIRIELLREIATAYPKEFVALLYPETPTAPEFVEYGRRMSALFLKTHGEVTIEQLIRERVLQRRRGDAAYWEDFFDGTSRRPVDPIVGSLHQPFVEVDVEVLKERWTAGYITKALSGNNSFLFATMAEVHGRELKSVSFYRPKNRKEIYEHPLRPYTGWEELIFEFQKRKAPVYRCIDDTIVRIIFQNSAVETYLAHQQSLNEKSQYRPIDPEEEPTKQ